MKPTEKVFVGILTLATVGLAIVTQKYHKKHLLNEEFLRQIWLIETGANYDQIPSFLNKK